MSRPCTHPPMTIKIAAPALLQRVAHGTHHMRPADLILRAALALGCLAATGWMIHEGYLVWPLVVGVVGALSLAMDAVELHAVAVVCDRITQEQDR